MMLNNHVDVADDEKGQSACIRTDLRASWPAPVWGSLRYLG
jgi:hypothetical protein